MSLFKMGNLRLSSGASSSWKIDMGACTDQDIATLAWMINLMVGEFGSVEGVPTGGLRLAKALEYYAFDGPHLIVDDVLTSGGSMEKARKQVSDPGIVGAVVFARGPCPAWISPLFQMPECFWITRPQ